MAPAIEAGDHVLMEGLSFWMRQPKRGEIVAFKTDGLDGVAPGTIYAKRIAGLPGERLRISRERLYANDAPTELTNAIGEIRYVHLRGSKFLTYDDETVSVPEDHYFLLGDNSAHSADSRFFGFVPAENLLGRITHCYWPPSRAGSIR